MSSNLQELINQVKPYLRQYLIENGVQITKKGNTEFFCCIHPDHPDKNPSSGFVKGTGDQQMHCFSCTASGDIFTAASWLEKKPLHGLAFVKENLEYLLNRYDIEYKLEYTEEQLVGLKVDAIYEEAARLLTSIESSTGKFRYIDVQPCVDRGWTEAICKKIGVGAVKDYSVFVKDVAKNVGLTVEDVQKHGIRKELFGSDRISITIKDHKSRVRGFVSRFLNWTKGSDTPKYYNTSIEDNPNYHKDSILFCLDLAKNYNSLRLDIFEGYGSAIVGHQNSYHNCVAIGSTAFTDKHIEIIRQLGFNHINFVLDQDKTGYDMMEKYIERFGNYPGLEVTITNLPLTEKDLSVPGQNDPDYYIRTYGLDSYRKVKPEGLFEHMILKKKEYLSMDTNPVFTKNFVKQVIPLIINQVDMIERSVMINTLSELTKIDKDDIRQEITRLEKTDVRAIREEIARKVRNTSSPDDLKDVLQKYSDTIQDAGITKNDKYLSSISESIEVFDSIFVDMNTMPEGIHGWSTGFPMFDNMLDGIPKPIKGGVAIGFASAPQHGKSAIMLNLAVNLARNNDDIAVCYWAIDDHRKAIAYRLVSMISGVPMKKVRNTIKRTEEEDKLIREAQEVIRELTNSRKLIFKDDRYGRSKSKADAWLKETQDATGNHILFCVDSLHNVQGEGESETRVKILTTSTWLKSLCAKMPATIMTSIELVKNKTRGEKPTLMSISESGKVEFDFDTLAIVWNESQGCYLPVESVSAKWGVPGNYKPIIELDFQKNKAGAGEKGSLFLKYDTETTAFVDCLSSQQYRAHASGPSTIVGNSGAVYKFGAAQQPPKETTWNDV